jgi:hypothetical protein
MSGRFVKLFSEVTEEIEESVQTIPKPNISNIRNKILRNEAYKKLKKEKKKVD